MSRSRFCALLLAGAIFLAPSAAGAQALADGIEDEEPDPIVVEAAVRSGSVETDGPLEIAVDRPLIRSLGVFSLSEAIASFAPQAASLRGEDDPIVLLGGRRIGDRREIDAIPQEAVLRIEIFPEEVARQYGFPPDRRVVNLILRPDFDALELFAQGENLFGAGRSTMRGRAGYTRLTPETRFNLDLSFRRRTAVEDEYAGEGRDTRWRVPHEDRILANGAWGARIGALDLSASLGGTWRRERSRLGGLAGTPGFERRDRLAEGRAGLTLGGRGEWLWSVVAATDVTDRKVETRGGDGGFVPLGNASVLATGRGFTFDAAASGPLGGSGLAIDFAGGIASRRSEARDLGGGPAGPIVAQDRAYASAGIDLPLQGDNALAAFVEGGMVSGLGGDALARYGGGLRMSPLAGLTLGATYSRAEDLPGFDDLAEPAIRTPNVRLYDYASGETLYAEMTEGGNPGLAPTLERSWALRAQFAPPGADKLAFSLDYADLASRNSASGPFGPTPQVEKAFPGRFVRGSGGELSGFDSRPVSLAREQRRQLRWGVNFTAPLGPVSAAPSDGQRAPPRPMVHLALYHGWTLDHSVRLADASPWIDLLDGAAIGNEGGKPRHRIDFQLGYADADLGIRLFGDWESATRLDEPAGPGGRLLDFARPVRLHLRAFFDLDVLDPDLKGRIYFAVDNLLGGKVRIRDAEGERVDYYRSGDGRAGQSFLMTFRHLFD